MKQTPAFITFLFIIAFAAPVFASPDEGELTRMLHEFLAGASQNDFNAHDRFWADDLIYTSSSGTRISKADIMLSVRAPVDPSNDEPATTYSAEDIRVQQYGDTAIVAFMLLGTSQGEKPELMKYFNTGTFVKRDDVWQVVAWQATRIPAVDQDR